MADPKTALYFYLIYDDLIFVAIQTRLHVGLFIFSVTETILWFQTKGTDYLIPSPHLDFQCNRDWNKELALGMEGMLKHSAIEEKSRHLNCLFSITPFNVAGCI